MATLRYIAFISENPGKITDFYNRFLGTKELGRSVHGDVSITDGFYHLTFFKKRPDLHEPTMEVGLHHVGVQVDSIEDVKARYLSFDRRGVIVEEAGDLQHGEMRIYDPECHPVSLSTKSFGVSAADGKQFPRVRHIAYNALEPERMLEFYNQVLGLRELSESDVRRRKGLANRFAGDGVTNLAIHPFYTRTEGHEVRFGINHIGFLVNTMEATIAELGTVLKIAARPSNRLYAEFRFRDPEGNALDLSQIKGWEVDVGKWEKAA
jgi:catechol 2,3-dioxygenase-like lactoylglutathione lyase family enzyme